MSNNLVVIGTLVKKREQILAEKYAAISRFDSEIRELETAIERLSGKKVWEVSQGALYDDEHPDYIRQSGEEI